MTTVSVLPIRHDGWTIADLDHLPDDGMHYELIDGALLVTPPPILRHDYAVTQLVGLLSQWSRNPGA